MNAPTDSKSWKTPDNALVLLAAAAPFCFGIWMALLNNYSVEVLHFGGGEIGTLHSIREIPGFLAFTAVFVLLILREQTFALLSLLMLGLGVMATGFFPSKYGLYITTLIMSIGFHYFETVQMSLSLQWLSKEQAPRSLGRQISSRSIASIFAYGAIWLLIEVFAVDYIWLYVLGGGVTIALTVFIWTAFPRIDSHTVQVKKIILRRRYWLYYALTFMGGARRQIFVVFAGFLLVQKFGYSASDVAALYLLNYLITSWVAPKLGGFIARFGERAALIFEYCGLIGVFLAYAVVENPQLAATLYVIDHLFFSFAIAQKTYLQKIADPADIAATSSVSFSINHIAAVFIPVLFGTYLWSLSPSYVFYAGAAMAVVSLLLSLLVPRNPAAGNETTLGDRRASPAMANA
ncbi:MAG: putative MFS family arabinose efflux permease [Paraglaciecola psychrophila]|jgi:predicted MFS family arabinose efflux permease